MDIDGLGDTAKALTETIREAIEFKPTLVFAGENGLNMSVYQNAFDDQASTFADGKTIRYQTSAALPAYHWPAQDRNSLGSAVVVNEFPAGTNPLTDTTVF